MAELIRRLAAQGLVKRKRSKADARAYVVALTPKGARAAATGAQQLHSVEADLLSALPAAKQKELLAAMARLVESNSG
jgi:DNA-binding MarR family transcriptional regulator